MATVTKTERAEAIERLREWIEPGDTVWTILRHVSASGMTRVIQCVKIENDKYQGDYIGHLGYNVARATDSSYDNRREGIRVQGCGMDMGFHIVYNLGRVLFPDGFQCVGEGCPSNDHSNGDRDYSPHAHSDGGYALRQRWI